MNNQAPVSLAKIFFQHVPKRVDPALVTLNRQLRNLKLKPFKRIHFEFDPFHPRVASIREFLIYLDNKRVRRTNIKCTFKTDILSGGQEPQVTCLLENDKKLIFKTARLSTIELLQYFNQYADKFDDSPPA